jgi:hypothetical protein
MPAFRGERCDFEAINHAVSDAVRVLASLIEELQRHSQRLLSPSDATRWKIT